MPDHEFIFLYSFTLTASVMINLLPGWNPAPSHTPKPTLSHQHSGLSMNCLFPDNKDTYGYPTPNTYIGLFYLYSFHATVRSTLSGTRVTYYNSRYR
jgi:hypothetical protein